MNEQNLDYLKNNLKKMGFGETLYPALENNLAAQAPEFILRLESEFNKQGVTADLHFRKSDNTDMYFFNKYDFTLQQGGEQGKELSQTFYLNNGYGVTLKEGFNLMNGRAVYKEMTPKEGDKYHAWIKLDFTEKDDKGNFKRQQYHDNYGFNLNDALAKYPIKELRDEKLKEELFKSLERGNVQQVSFEKEGQSEKLFIEANPQFKSMTVYDGKMTRIKTQEVAEKWVNGESVIAKEGMTKEGMGKDQLKKKDEKETESAAADNKKGKRKGIKL